MRRFNNLFSNRCIGDGPMAFENNNTTDDETQALDPFTVAVDTLRQGKYRESLGGVNPTGASAMMINERGEEVLVGKCLRQVWYSKKRVPRTNPAGDNSQFIFMLGNMAEEGLQDAWRKAGVLLEENAKIRKNIAKNPDTDDEIMLSGEVDAIVRWSKCEQVMMECHECTLTQQRLSALKSSQSGAMVRKQLCRATSPPHTSMDSLKLNT